MNRVKSTLAALIGNALEYYDVTLYAFFSAIFAKLYFPSDDPYMSQIMALGAFAAGATMRPIGGMVFGHIGDRYGRKTALVLAVLLVSLPTTIMGLLPTYASIGIAAPIILVLCRLLQGLCTGGEYAGASVFILEHSRGKKSGFFCSLLPTSSLSGALLGTLIGVICTQDTMPESPWSIPYLLGGLICTQETILENAWRIPFLLGGVFGIIGFFVRRMVPESPDFVDMKQQKKVSKFPLLKALRRDWKSALCTMGISINNLAHFYLVVAFMIPFALPEGISLHNKMIINSSFLAMLAITFPLMGYLGDKIGVRRVMLISALLIIVFAIPVLWAVMQFQDILSEIILVSIFALLGTGMIAGSASFTPRMYHSQDRYSGLAVSTGLGDMIGISTPLVATWLVAQTGIKIAPAFYMVFIGVIALISVKCAPIFYNPKTKDQTA
ncbi:MAG: MFS transporter [Alphaproteobacteria bacterium]